MKAQTLVPHRTTTRVLLLLTVAMMGGSSSAWAAPPQKHEPGVVRGLEKVGDFFFKVARKLEQTGYAEDALNPEIIYEVRRAELRRAETESVSAPSTGLALPPGYRPGDELRDPAASRRPSVTQRPVAPQQMAKVESFTPPNFQPNPQPRLFYPKQTKPLPRSSLNLPVPLPTASSSRSSQRQTLITPSTIDTFDPPPTPPVRTSPGTVQQENPAATPAPAVPVFATPAPGRRGFVYPPGVEHEQQNMIDVRDFAPGQKVRDPRSGKIFLVPPK